MSRRSKRVLDDNSSITIEAKKNKKNDEVEILINDETLSDYEKIRLSNIKKNQDFLSSLGLDEVKPGPIIKKETTSIRGAIKKKGITKPIVATRRSGRVTIEKLSSEIKDLEEKSGGKSNNEELDKKKSELEVLLALKKAEGSFGSYEPQASEFAEDSRERITDDEISMIPPTNAADEDDQGRDIITALKDTQNFISKSPSKSKSDEFYNKRISKLSVNENDFAKVAEARITSIWAHPSQSKCIVAAGDKTGCIGLWDVNADIEGKGLGGVYRYRPHASNVISLHCNANDPSKLFSGSYDGTIRYLDLNKESFLLGFESPESIYDVMFKDVTFLENKAYIGTKGGDINFVDLRVGNKKYTWSYEIDCSINSLQVHPTNSNFLISAGLKGVIQVHDLRKSSKKWQPIVRMEEHTKSVSAAYVSPDGKYLASVGLDDTVRIWTDFLKPSYSKPVVFRHDNFTGRWLSVFKPSWDPKHPHSFVLGSMEKVRNVEVFSPVESNDKKTHLSMITKLKGGYLTSVCSRNIFHPTLDMIVCGNSSGKVFILR